MGVSVKAGTFTVLSSDTVGTTQTVTVGFQPVAIICWYHGQTSATDAITNQTARYGFGFGTSTTDRRCVSIISTHASAAINGGRVQRSDALVSSVLNTGTEDGLLDIDSITSTAFVTIVDDQFDNTLVINYLAIGGTDITNVTTGVYNAATSVGNFDVTSLAFQPDFVLCIAGGFTADPPSTSASRGFQTIGAATSSSARWVVTVGEGPEANATSQSKSYGYDGEFFAIPLDTPTTIGTREDFVSFLSNGFRLNHLEGTNAYRVHFLAVKGGNWKVGNGLTQTDTVTDIAFTGFGFAPVGGLIASHMLAKSTQDTVQAGGSQSIGAFTSTSERGAQAMLQEDRLTDTDVTDAIEYDEVYINISSSSAVQGLMDIKSMDSDGFTAIMDDADPSQAFFGYFAVGPTAAAGQSVNKSEAITVSESHAESVGTSQVNKSEAVAVAETVTPLVTSFINLSDAAAVAEAVTVAVINTVSVSDAVGVAESHSESVGTSQINVSDAVTTAESVTAVIEVLVNKSDAVGVAESQVVEVINVINVSDAIAVTESHAESVGTSQVNTSEAITTAESLTAVVEVLVNKSEAVGVAESQVVEIITAVNVNEAIAVTESHAEAVGTSQINVSDAVAVSESKTVTIEGDITLSVNNSDSISVSESHAETVGTSQITTSDSVAVNEAVVMQLILFVAITADTSRTRGVKVI